MSTYPSVVISPDTITNPVVTRVSQRHAGMGSSAQHRVQDGVGDPVGELVGMTLGDGLGREEVGPAHARGSLAVGSDVRRTPESSADDPFAAPPLRAPVCVQLRRGSSLAGGGEEHRLVGVGSETRPLLDPLGSPPAGRGASRRASARPARSRSSVSAAKPTRICSVRGAPPARPGCRASARGTPRGCPRPS